jgi:CheY-like chemotaxis protein
LVEIASFSSSGRHERARALVLVCTAHADLTQQLLAQVSAANLVACVAHGVAGCLRVATAVGPDLIVVDASVPGRVIDMLRSHPSCRTARIIRLPTGSLDVELRDYKIEHQVPVNAA